MDNLEAESHIINNNEDTQGDLAKIAQKFYDEKDYEKALKMYTEMLFPTLIATRSAKRKVRFS